MGIFQIHEGRVKVGELILTTAEYEAVRPGQPLPELPEGIVTCRYDAATGAVRASDGATQQEIDFDTAAADAILADGELAADLAAWRVAQE